MTTTTETTTTCYRRVKHKQECSHPPLTSARKPGGKMRVTCEGCARYITLEAGEPSHYWELPGAPPRTAPSATTPPPPPPPPAPVALGYACREHYQPVSWRGTGCPKCDRERRDARRTRKARRAARLDPEPTQ